MNREQSVMSKPVLQPGLPPVVQSLFQSVLQSVLQPADDAEATVVPLDVTLKSAAQFNMLFKPNVNVDIRALLNSVLNKTSYSIKYTFMEMLLLQTQLQQPRLSLPLPIPLLLLPPLPLFPPSLL